MKVKLGQIHEKNNIRKRITLSTFNKMWNALMVLKLNYIRCFIGCVKKKRKQIFETLDSRTGKLIIIYMFFASSIYRAICSVNRYINIWKIRIKIARNSATSSKRKHISYLQPCNGR